MLFNHISCRFLRKYRTVRRRSAPDGALVTRRLLVGEGARLWTFFEVFHYKEYNPHEKHRPFRDRGSRFGKKHELPRRQPHSPRAWSPLLGHSLRELEDRGWKAPQNRRSGSGIRIDETARRPSGRERFRIQVQSGRIFLGGRSPPGGRRTKDFPSFPRRSRASRTGIRGRVHAVSGVGGGQEDGRPGHRGADQPGRTTRALLRFRRARPLDDRIGRDRRKFPRSRRADDRGFTVSGCRSATFYL